MKKAKRVFAVASLLILAQYGMVHAAEVEPEHVDVILDRAKMVKLPPHVDTIVIGNPSIADVTMVRKNGLMVVTGKGFGETNVIFLDAAGQALSEATITVRMPQGLLVVQRGMDRESYSCVPRCEPAVSLGDNTKFLTDTSGQITTRNGMMAPPSH